MSDASAGAETLVICGPTAAGKSAIAMWIAERTEATIISADSRQVYRGFDIGTAKPPLAERGLGVRARSLTPTDVLNPPAIVPHFGIDVCDPTQRYSAATWAEAADAWIEETLMAHRRPLVVGGTGLYLRALFDGLFDEPVLDAERRAALDAFLEALGRDELQRWVTALDAPRAHLGRTQLLRAVEIALLTGHRVSDLHRDRPRQSRWQPRYLVVDPGAALAERISARIDHMLDNGWPDEVRHLMQTVPEDAPAWNAAGYDAVRRLVRGELSRRAAHEIVLIETRQYAKRQRTWFRHQLPPDRVTRIDPMSADWMRAVERWASLEAVS